MQYAKRWGMSVAVGDLHRAIGEPGSWAARSCSASHSLGGSVVTPDATWNFNGRAGARDLAGLIYIDGGSGPAESASQASSALTALNAPSATPWLSFGGIPAPFAGLFKPPARSER